MTRIVPVSENERLQSGVSDATAQATYEALHRFGCVRFFLEPHDG